MAALHEKAFGSSAVSSYTHHLLGAHGGGGRSTAAMGTHRHGATRAPDGGVAALNVRMPPRPRDAPPVVAAPGRPHV